MFNTVARSKLDKRSSTAKTLLKKDAMKQIVVLTSLGRPTVLGWDFTSAIVFNMIRTIVVVVAGSIWNQHL
jgi:hypothetical protein